MLRWVCALVLACPFVVFVSDIVHAQTQANRKEMMKDARRTAEQGQAYILVLSGEHGQGGINVFYNNPRPFCYFYTIPGGGWVKDSETAWRSADGRQLVGVMFTRSQDLNDLKGETLLERAATLIGSDYEKVSGQPRTGVKLAPFESALQGTWKWTADPATQGDRQIAYPPKIIADISPDGVAVITTVGTADDDGLARHIIATLKTTKNPQCYFPLLDAMLKLLSERKR